MKSDITNSTEKFIVGVIRSVVEPLQRITSSLLHSVDMVMSGDSEKKVYTAGREYRLFSDEFKSIVRSFFWMTYRSGFEPIDEARQITRDTGWGCMLRCGQMMMARALCRAYLSEDFSWPSSSCEDSELYNRILKMFVDECDQPYSIHRIVRSRSCEDKPISSWFGPNAIAQALRRISQEEMKINGNLPICVHVSLDQMVIIDEILLAWRNAGQEANAEIPLFIIVPLRTGFCSFDEKFYPTIKECFKLRSFLGFIGGRPRHALYVIACADEHLIYLDPHTTQASVSTPLKDDSSFHTDRINTLHFSSLDPSLALGFLCNNMDDFDELMKSLRKSFDDLGESKLFEILERRPSFEKFDNQVLDWE